MSIQTVLARLENAALDKGTRIKDLRSYINSCLEKLAKAKKKKDSAKIKKLSADIKKSKTELHKLGG